MGKKNFRIFLWSPFNAELKKLLNYNIVWFSTAEPAKSCSNSQQG